MNEETRFLLAELRSLVERPPTSPWMDAREAATYLRLEAKSLQNMTSKAAVKAGTSPPFHRLSGTGAKRFHRGELDEWLLTAKNPRVTLASSQMGRHRANGPPPATGRYPDDSSER